VVDGDVVVDGGGVDGGLVEEMGGMCGCVVVEEKGEGSGSLGWWFVVRKRLPRRWEVDRRLRIHGTDSLDLFESLRGLISKKTCLIEKLCSRKR